MMSTDDALMINLEHVEASRIAASWVNGRLSIYPRFLRHPPRSRRGCQAPFDSVLHQLRRRADIQLVHQVVLVPLDGASMRGEAPNLNRAS